MEKMMQYQ